MLYRYKLELLIISLLLIGGFSAREMIINSIGHREAAGQAKVDFITISPTHSEVARLFDRCDSFSLECESAVWVVGVKQQRDLVRWNGAIKDYAASMYKFDKVDVKLKE